MKKLYYLCSALFLTFTSCSKENYSEENIKVEFTLDYEVNGIQRAFGA